MTKLGERFKNKPMIYYAASIVASWAGVGSLMNFSTLANKSGGWAAIIWGIFNSLACIIFGVVIDYVPTMRKVMKSKVMFYLIAGLTVFQTWTQMSGIQEIFGETPLGSNFGMILAYIVSIAFVVMLLVRGMIRNVLTDTGSWILVYLLLGFLTVASIINTRGDFNNISMAVEMPVIKSGILNGLLLVAGPFTNPYYYEIYDYNDVNEDGTRHIKNIKTSFVLAGVMFGAYMVFAGLIAWTKFNPSLSILKAILISIIAISSLSTYLYAEYIAFGKKGGFVVNLLTVAGWYFLIPLGVMGIWKLMSQIRWVFILGALIVALFIKYRDKKSVKEVDQNAG